MRNIWTSEDGAYIWRYVNEWKKDRRSNRKRAQILTLLDWEESMKRFAIIFDKIFLKHQADYGHPESPHRVETILQRLNKDDIKDFIDFFSPEKATKEEILWNHTE